jgi:hypothetical protein
LLSLSIQLMSLSIKLMQLLQLLCLVRAGAGRLHHASASHHGLTVGWLGIAAVPIARCRSGGREIESTYVVLLLLLLGGAGG